MGALREKMIEEIRLRNFSPRTEHSYVSAMVGLAKYYRQPPDQLSQEQIRAYLLHLKERGLSPSSRNVAISGMKFFYQQCLGWNEKQLFIPPRKRSWQLPEVLSQKEVLAATTQRDRCLLMTAYATGLRVSELVRLKVSAELGGHLKQCDRCGFEHPSYNSCRNRHCPKCQSLAKAKWLKKQTAELLPVGYFHLVFALPHEFNRLILANKKILLALLFKAVSETLLEFGQRRFGGTVGIIAVLHTWDQTLKDHFHLPCLVPAGALSLDHSRWIGARPNFLFPITALSQVFRGKFLALLQQACEKGKIPPATNETKAARQKSWVVYAKKPFGSPQTVLDYLGRYTHRVALSNDRILSVQNGQVTLSYRDRKDGDKKKTVSLEAHEFIRRFLLHVLPDGFMRIRHFGFLANRAKKHALPQCRKLLGLSAALPELPKKSAHDLLLELSGIDLSRCPRCLKGTLIVIGELPKVSRWDSS